VIDGDVGVRDPATVELRMAPRAENLSLARLALAGVGPVAGASDGEVADLKLAVTEACTNAILHAYGDGAGDGGQLVVRYRVGPGTLEIEVEDDGSGFDPDDPGARESTAGGQGMGLMIIRALTDTLEIHSDASGSRITFRKAVGETVDG
jgi:serine/threonine-protein kinase RsbW